MLSKILPEQFNNEYHGNKLALWVFYAITAITVWRSQHHLLAPDGGAQSIASIPLDSYSTEASATVISIFAFWGLSQLILGLLYVLVLLRYRSAIPLMYLLGALEYLARSLIGVFKPIETLETAPGAIINIPFTVLMLIMLWLSIRKPASSG